MPTNFSIANAIVIVSYDTDGKDHNRMLRWVMQICQWENLKFNKTKCHFRCMRVPLFRGLVWRWVVQPEPWPYMNLLMCHTHITKKSSIIYRCLKLPERFFTSHCKGMLPMKRNLIYKNTTHTKSCVSEQTPLLQKMYQCLKMKMSYYTKKQMHQLLD